MSYLNQILATSYVQTCYEWLRFNFEMQINNMMHMSARCELLSIKKKEMAFLDPTPRTTKKCVKLQEKNIGQLHITQSR